MSELKIQQCRLDGRYDILDCLGRGSYAEVYLADDAAADGGPQRVVIKALNTHLQGSPDEELERTLTENFRNEALALDRVRHPNVINRLGHGTAIDLTGRTFHYLVLEYMPGGDMQALCRRRPLSLARAVGYLEQIGAGLEHAHEHGVIHRDVKPSNLLLTADQSVVKITDFGVAKLEADGAITRVGTDVYAAPEHHPLMHTGQLEITAALAHGRQLTPAADVYSLAKTAYMLLTGEAPRRFSQKPITELPPPYSEEPWAPFVLRVLRRATATAPSERYQTVREFREELRDALMPHTQLLTQPNGERTAARFAEEDLKAAAPAERFAPGAATPPPPTPSFESATPAAPGLSPPGVRHAARPRIVVPVAAEPAPGALPARRPPRREEPAARYVPPEPEDEFFEDERDYARRPRLSARSRTWLVALLLIVLFAGMLLATHTYVRSLRRNTTGGEQGARGAAAGSQQQSPVGREFIARTDVNLRSAPSGNSTKVGMVDKGARVRVLSAVDVNGDGRPDWYQVEVLERARVLDEPSADEGWADKDYLRER